MPDSCQENTVHGSEEVMRTVEVNGMNAIGPSIGVTGRRLQTNGSTSIGNVLRLLVYRWTNTQPQSTDNKEKPK